MDINTKVLPFGSIDLLPRTGPEKIPFSKVRGWKRIRSKSLISKWEKLPFPREQKRLT